MHVCNYVCFFVYVRMNAFMHARMLECMYVRMSVSQHARMFAIMHVICVRTYAHMLCMMYVFIHV